MARVGTDLLIMSRIYVRNGHPGTFQFQVLIMPQLAFPTKNTSDDNSWSKAENYEMTGLIGQLTHRVEQDVGCFEVAVDDRRVGAVEEGEALGSADGDLHPRHPRHGTVDASEEVLLQAAGSHELVRQHPVLLLVAVPDELHQVPVPQLPKEEHLRLQNQSWRS